MDNRADNGGGRGVERRSNGGFGGMDEFSLTAWPLGVFVLAASPHDWLQPVAVLKHMPPAMPTGKLHLGLGMPDAFAN